MNSKIYFLLISILLSQIVNAQLKFYNTDLGEISKENEFKIRYITIENPTKNNYYVEYINSSENHQNIYIGEDTIDNKSYYSSSFRLEAHSKTKIGIRFKFLSLKQGLKYNANLFFKYKSTHYRDDYSILKLTIPISYQVKRKLKIDSIIFKDRLNYDKTYSIKLKVKNTCKFDLKFEDKYSKTKQLITFSKNKTSQIDINFCPKIASNIFLRNLDGLDLDYSIPITYKLTKSKYQPIIHVDSSSVTMLRYKESEDKTVKFPVFNLGNSPLLITNCSGSGCIVPTYPREPIKPGQFNYVFITCDTKIVGPINKQISINSNDPVNPNIYVQLKGEIYDKVE